MRGMQLPVRYTDLGVVAEMGRSLMGEARDGYPVIRGVPRGHAVPLLAGPAWAHSIVDGDPMNPTSPTSVVVRWRELARVEAVEPWPSLLLVWQWPNGGDDGCIFVPRSARVAEPFAEEVERLVLHCERFVPTSVVRGWLDVPEVPWEQVARGPSDEQHGGGAGAYRSAAIAPEERIVARRAAPTSFETLLLWLASTPERPFRDHPREVIVTEQHVYRRSSQGWARVPLETLRAARGAADGPRVYVFGRRTLLLLPHRAECAVREALDARSPVPT